MLPVIAERGLDHFVERPRVLDAKAFERSSRRQLGHRRLCAELDRHLAEAAHDAKPCRSKSAAAAESALDGERVHAARAAFPRMLRAVLDDARPESAIFGALRDDAHEDPEIRVELEPRERDERAVRPRKARSRARDRRDRATRGRRRRRAGMDCRGAPLVLGQQGRRAARNRRRRSGGPSRERVQSVTKAGQRTQLDVGLRVGILAEAVDPDRRQTELDRRRDVVVQARADVDVRVRGAPRLASNASQCLWPACTSRSRRRRSRARTGRRSAGARRRCSRGRCSRGSRASSRAPRVLERRRRRRGTAPSTGASARARPLPRTRAAALLLGQARQRDRQHLAVARIRPLALVGALELVVAVQQPRRRCSAPNRRSSSRPMPPFQSIRVP